MSERFHQGAIIPRSRSADLRPEAAQDGEGLLVTDEGTFVVEELPNGELKLGERWEP